MKDNDHVALMFGVVLGSLLTSLGWIATYSLWLQPPDPPKLRKAPEPIYPHWNIIKIHRTTMQDFCSELKRKQ